ncbi:MAG: hypothetical protein GY789_10735 [Hyphomicrobiales bacterium]|nr:hypothetical protein [Hyphomicrobiales bacterium]MCP5002300.1 hypothetical protein [Hyphomicrobiales bacterium]
MLRKFALHSILAVATFVSVAFSGIHVAQANALGFGKYGTCESAHIHREITRRFRTLEFNVLHAGLKIEDIFEVRENGFNYTPRTEVQLIARRFCQGRVSMNDGKTRSIWFLIERGQGFAGVGYNVEFCIAGLDPWHIYGAYCRSVR